MIQRESYCKPKTKGRGRLGVVVYSPIVEMASLGATTGRRRHHSLRVLPPDPKETRSPVHENAHAQTIKIISDFE